MDEDREAGTKQGRASPPGEGLRDPFIREAWFPVNCLPPSERVATVGRFS